MMDMEFEKLKDGPDMELIDLNTTAACEHVREIEKAIRIIKKRARYVMKTLVIACILNSQSDRDSYDLFCYYDVKRRTCYSRCL